MSAVVGSCRRRLTNGSKDLAPNVPSDCAALTVDRASTRNRSSSATTCSQTKLALLESSAGSWSTSHQSRQAGLGAVAHHGRVGNAMIFAVVSAADRVFGIGADIGDPFARR